MQETKPWKIAAAASRRFSRSDDGCQLPCAWPAVSAAPDVDTAGLALVEGRAAPVGEAVHLLPAAARSVKYNLPLEQMHAPVLGPSHPGLKDGTAAGLRNHRSGHVEAANMSDFAFDEQYNTFQSFGYAADPGGAGTVKNAKGAAAEAAAGEQTVFVNAPKRQRTDKGGGGGRAAAAAQAFDPSVPFSLVARQPWAEKQVEQVELTDEQKEYIAKASDGRARSWVHLALALLTHSLL